jgi:hypothetical protein
MHGVGLEDGLRYLAGRLLNLPSEIAEFEAHLSKEAPSTEAAPAPTPEPPQESLPEAEVGAPEPDGTDATSAP